jgi:shikimate dehydrogenase
MYFLLARSITDWKAGSTFQETPILIEKNRMTVPPTFQLGLIGEGIQESMSPALHEAEGEHHGMRIDYDLIDLDLIAAEPDDVGDLVRAARTLGFKGLNITHPVKQRVIEHLDELSDEARNIGAVNTVVIDGERLIGHNTDAYGFFELSRRALVNEKTDNVVQFGAGGAGSAVAYANLQGPTGVLHLVDIDFGRSEALAASLAKHFGDDRVRAARVEEIPNLIADADGFVNATPMGMAGFPGTPIDTALLTDKHWVMDIVYFPLETQLMAEAAARGARVTGGTGMTAFQAAMAFELFTGLKPNPERMLAHINELVRERLDTLALAK